MRKKKRMKNYEDDIILIDQNEWFSRIIPLQYVDRIKTPIHSIFNIMQWDDITTNYNRDNKISTDFYCDLSIGPSSLQCSGDDDWEWSNSSASVIIYVNEERMNIEVDRMVKIFNNRKNPETNSTKCIAEFKDFDIKERYGYKLILRQHINSKLKQHKLKFTGTSIQNLYKKPKQQVEQTETDIAREKLFYDLFEKAEKQDVTNDAIKCLITAIALTEGLSADDYNAGVTKRIIGTRCFNEIIYAKLAGAEDLNDVLNEAYGTYTASKYTEYGKIEIVKHQFVSNCKNKDADKIFDTMYDIISQYCGGQTLKQIIRKLASTFEEFNT